MITEKGTLYVVATPIGNLADMTMRGAEILRSVDIIAAEDTRRTLCLLNSLNIKNRLISFHEHNSLARKDELISLLLEGKDVALVTDAGTPLISDPGAVLTEAAANEDIKIVCIPGACAAIAALCVSALPVGRFMFEGFLPRGKERAGRLKYISNLDCAVVLYESPHHLCTTLNDLAAVLGERRISICKELTKIHETVFRTTAVKAAELFEGPQKGEYVIVIEGAVQVIPEEISDDDIILALKERLSTGISKKSAATEVAELMKLSRNRVYKLSLEM